MKKTLLAYTMVFFAFSIVKGQDIRPFGIAIYVSNLEESTQWYQDVFNVESYKTMSYPEYGVFKIELLKNKNLYFELVQRDNSFSVYDIKPDYDIRQAPLEGFYKLTFEIDEIEKFYNKLKSKEVKIHWDLNQDDELKIKTFIIKDPDNNLIQFIEKI